jgi:hypothetical protein
VKPGTALQLGRVSNLPTVWSNALAGAVLAGAAGFGTELALLLAAFTLFYTGGMFLNDAFDAALDARARPERPIPSGAATRGEVFGWGFAQMAAGVALLALVGAAPALAGLTLAVAITYYDWHHKTDPFSPVVMGLCRVLIYVGAGLAYAPALPGALWTGAALLLCYLIGLTYVAKQENLERVENLWPLAFLAAPVAYGAWLGAAVPLVLAFWAAFTAWMLWALWYLRRRRKGDIPRAVVSLIAGISLLDALLVAGAGAPGLALLALAAFGVTLYFQRYVAGT